MYPKVETANRKRDEFNESKFSSSSSSVSAETPARRALLLLPLSTAGVFLGVFFLDDALVVVDDERVVACSGVVRKTR